mmetsp:Transcript_31434/g.82453  ORF Transcript_31434/g.82453 Transcript_31434/m.82453 type:complete len:218 (-) Transcript_31434:269-922(-)
MTIVCAPVRRLHVRVRHHPRATVRKASCHRVVVPTNSTGWHHHALRREKVRCRHRSSHHPSVWARDELDRKHSLRCHHKGLPIVVLDASLKPRRKGWWSHRMPPHCVRRPHVTCKRRRHWSVPPRDSVVTAVLMTGVVITRTAPVGYGSLCRGLIRSYGILAIIATSVDVGTLRDNLLGVTISKRTKFDLRHWALSRSGGRGGHLALLCRSLQDLCN